MSKERRVLLQSTVAFALAVGGLLVPSRADASDALVCGPGACVSDCVDAEAACQFSGPHCHTTGCFTGEGCADLNEVDCAIS